MEIKQGDVYWVPRKEPNGAETSHTHPHVVVQEDVLNRSRIHTVVVCALTTNLKRAKAPGNVLLDAGEANLPRQSVVVVSQVSAFDKTELGEYVGTLTRQRIKQILDGMRFLQVMTEHHENGKEKG
jgi:mRNA interferase MazF